METIDEERPSEDHAGPGCSYREAVADLGTEPRPVGSQKLQGTDHAYRIRIGDYRAVDTVSDRLQTVTVIRVRHRKDSYRA